MENDLNPSLSAKPYNKRRNKLFKSSDTALIRSDKASHSSDGFRVTPGKTNPEKMNAAIDYQSPRLYDAGGDLSREWFVFFYARNEFGKFVRFKKTEGLAKCASVEERRMHGSLLCLKYDALLRDGWNPFKVRRKAVNGNQNAPSPAADFVAQFRVINCTEAFLKYKKETLRDKSSFTYQTKIRCFNKWIQDRKLGGVMINQFSDAHARRFITELKSRKSISDRTHNSYITTLKTCWNWIIDSNDNINIRNPWSDIPLLKKTKARKTTFTPAERDKIFSYLKENDVYMWIVCRLIYQVFIRPGREISGLRVRDIDFLDNKIWIRAENSKNKNTQSVPLPIDVKEKLLELNIAAYNPDHFLFAVHGPSPYRCGRDHWSKRFTAALRRLGFRKGLTIYILKHTGNKVAHLNGMPLKEQQELNRHHSLDQMAEYLSDITASKAEELGKYFKD